MIRLNPKYVRVLQAMAAVVAIGSAAYTFVFRDEPVETPVAGRACLFQLTIQH